FLRRTNRAGKAWPAHSHSASATKHHSQPRGSWHRRKRPNLSGATDVVQKGILFAGGLDVDRPHTEAASQRIPSHSRSASGRSRDASLDPFASTGYRFFSGMVCCTSKRLAAAHTSRRIPAVGRE